MKRGAEYRVTHSEFPLEDTFPRKLSKLKNGSLSTQADVSLPCGGLWDMRDEGTLESMQLSVAGFNESRTARASPGVPSEIPRDEDPLQRQFLSLQQQALLSCDTAAGDMRFHPSQALQMFAAPSPSSTSSEIFNNSIPDLMSPQSPSLGSEPPTPTAPMPFPPTTLKRPPTAPEGTQLSVQGSIAKAPSVSMPFRTFSNYVNRAAHQRQLPGGASTPAPTCVGNVNSLPPQPHFVVDDSYLPKPATSTVDGDGNMDGASRCPKPVPRFFRPPPRFVPPLTRPEWHPAVSCPPNPPGTAVPFSPTSAVGSHHTWHSEASGPITQGKIVAPGGTAEMSAPMLLGNGGTHWQSLVKMVSLEGDGRPPSKRVDRDSVGSGAMRPGTYVIQVPSKMVPAAAGIDDGRRMVFARMMPRGAETVHEPETGAVLSTCTPSTHELSPDLPGVQGSGRQVCSTAGDGGSEGYRAARGRPWPEAKSSSSSGLGEFLLNIDLEAFDETELLRILEEEDRSDQASRQAGLSAKKDPGATGMQESICEAPQKTASDVLQSQVGLTPLVGPVVTAVGGQGRETLGPPKGAKADAAKELLTEMGDAPAMDCALGSAGHKEQPEKQTSRKKGGASQTGKLSRHNYQHHGFQKVAIKRLVQAVLPGDAVISPAVTEALTEVANMFVVELIRKGKSLMKGRGEGQPIEPQHVREAYRQIKEAPRPPTSFHPMIFR